MRRVQADPDAVAPSEFASFQKLSGKDDTMAKGDEFVVRMPGPWDGPVRVVDVTSSSFRLATLEGHLEAGQIEFRARDDGEHVVFEIESWARSGDRLSDLLYDRLRMSKATSITRLAWLASRTVRRAPAPLMLSCLSISSWPLVNP